MSADKKVNKKNLIIRITSLVCAIILWFYVAKVENPSFETSFSNVPVTIDNYALLEQNELAIINQGDFLTDIVISGKKSLLNQLDASDIKASIDLSEITDANEYNLKINIVTPTGTSVVSSNPKSISLSVDRQTKKTFPIETDVKYSNLPSAYTTGDYEIFVDNKSEKINSVTVSGPEKELERISRVVASVDFGDVEASVEAKSELVMFDSLGNKISSSSLKLSSDTVTVRLPVYMQKILKLSVEQAYNTFSSEQIIFKISPSTIAVKGDPRVLADMDTLSLRAFNEKTIGENLTETLNSTISLPEGFEFTGAQMSASVTARLVNVEKNYIQVPTTAISTKNLANGLKVSFEDEQIEIIGINSTSAPLGEKDVKISLDLTKYTEQGTYTASVTATTIDRINHAYIVQNDYPVTFTITKK